MVVGNRIHQILESTTKLFIVHRQFPDVVTVLWQGSDDAVTILSSTSGTSGRLHNCVSVPPWFLHSDCVLLGI